MKRNKLMMLGIAALALIFLLAACGGKKAAESTPASQGGGASASGSQSSRNQPAFVDASDNDFNVGLTADNTVIITKYIGSGGNISVPAKIQGIQVTELATGVFSSNNDITGVRLPEGLKIIGQAAFQFSANISTVIIPNTVTTIGNYAFAYCGSLKSITIPDSVTSFGESIFAGVLNGRSGFSGLEEFTVPAGMIASGRIPEYMLQGSNLKQIVIPEGITTIERSAFASCETLTSVTLPSTIKKIGNNAFNFCRELTEVIIPESVTSIEWEPDMTGSHPFFGCRKLNLASQARLRQLGHTGF